MKRIVPFLCGLVSCTTLTSNAQDNGTINVEKSYITTILQTLAADEMRGRSALSTDIEKAADYIASEFQNIGLTPYQEQNYRQTFQVQKITPTTLSFNSGGQPISDDKLLVISRQSQLDWNQTSGIPSLEIPEGANFSEEFRKIVQGSYKQAIVKVHPSFANYFTRFKKIYGKESLVTVGDPISTNSFVFILDEAPVKDFELHFKNNTETVSLFNIAGILPGKSKANEFVIFSAHYDHIGILDAEGQDSIANGADDDASGVTAMIALAKHFKQKADNERTLLFVAFTGEEIGMYGSTYFSKKINPESVTAMINMEMIGKDSKFGPNTMYITGYDQSNLGRLMQENLKGSKFKFYADPYPKQNLFYRSDNAVLAAQGVPAHSFSTSQMDQDHYYHTVKDEVSTLNIDNIKASIEAIAIGTTGIIMGVQTPSRVEKLRD